MSTKLIQLRSGQFLIGFCTMGDDGSLTIEEPFEIVIETVPRRDGQGMEPRAGMFPYCMMSADRIFSFSADQIQLSPREADPNCAENYRRVTGGITTATAAPAKPGILLKG